MPAYKGFTKKRLGANNVATLEKVYAHDRYPDDSMVDSVHRATKLPRSKIVAWFKTKREEEKAAKRRVVRGRFGDARGRARGTRAGTGMDFTIAGDDAGAGATARDPTGCARVATSSRGAKLRSTRFHLGMDPRRGLNSDDDVTMSML